MLHLLESCGVTSGIGFIEVKSHSAAFFFDEKLVKVFTQDHQIWTASNFPMKAIFYFFMQSQM